MSAVKKKVAGAQIWIFEKDRRLITILALAVLLLIILNLATIKGLWSAYFGHEAYDGRYKRAPAIEKSCNPQQGNWPACQFKKKASPCNPLRDGFDCLKG